VTDDRCAAGCGSIGINRGRNKSLQYVGKFLQQIGRSRCIGDERIAYSQGSQASFRACVAETGLCGSHLRHRNGELVRLTALHPTIVKLLSW